MAKESITKEIIENYNYFDEDNRLKSACGILEKEHTCRLILRYIKTTPLNIYDIGAGTGHYSSWLAELGHRIYFSDIVPKHVETFKSRFGTNSNVISIKIEDARNLSYENDVADLVILNGPLYHLIEKKDRLQVLKEAKRILKDNGRLLAFSISRFAGLNYALSSGEVFNDAYFEMVREEVTSGIRTNSTLKNKTFISAYFHLLEEIEAEITESGLIVENSFGVGQAWSPPDLETVILDNEKKQRLLQAAEMMERYPMQSPKILTVGNKS
ncbi:MAG TPA: methyltransferase domain-containing protein [Chitinophagaceae bacterium]|jgi:SAM-dependent methyltransferase|nr:methyltransferase domain-containing protein [Chitinophagaceae bacterium]